jgi:hypothetical protein
MVARTESKKYAENATHDAIQNPDFVDGEGVTINQLIDLAGRLGGSGQTAALARTTFCTN